ncbi:DUF3987 domain-containing protein [Cupriavidus sp. SW-Y-13]|uniref:DUF3987 domain-containing protein n=1 Tax=Cupriavidus sp. SW-Y-13 TaxID=2653854 RepID=UPI001366040D|nr:DUF3987 domain-containing protein [Cupriavidus sp. SW-Y-13]MWL88598.1 DUF3987 domain-containing protein [Cupriavidus sp. SW-Y-13]
MMQGNPPPLHALAPGIREVIEEQAKTPATKISLAGFVDGYVSQTAGPCVQVRGLYGETIPATVYVLIIAPRGAGKSPMGAHFRQHFDTWHDNYVSQTAGAWQEYQGKLEVWKAEKAGILKTIKKHAAAGLETDAHFQQRLIELEKNPPQPPPSPSERFEDTTIAPWMVSAVKHPATFFCADESGPILESMNKDLIGALCGGWSEVPPSRARSHTGVQVVRVMPTVVLSVQNDVWLNFQSKAKGRLFMEIGMGSRPIYYVVHQSDFAKQSADVSDEPDRIALPRLLDRAAHFLGIQDQLNQRGWMDRKVLELSQPAKREARDTEKYLNSIRGSAASPDELSLIDKAVGNILRHAGRHHEFNGIDGPIQAEEIANSAEWVLWSLENYVRLSESGQTSGRNVEKDAEALWNLMLDLRVRDCKMTKRRLAEEAFNVGLARSTHFIDALSLLCQEDVATVRDGYVYWDRPDRVGHLIRRDGKR